MKILTVLTGGTIGSKIKNHTVDVKGACCEVVEKYKSTQKDKTEFQVVSPINILSENMSVDYWNSLTELLSSLSFKDYDGIILTHGSDTLSYTSALLSICFAHISIPLVIVAADYPLENPHSNGLQNFTAAVDLIKSRLVKGVFVSYGTQDKTSIYLASRLQEADGFLDKFRDFTYTPLAIYEKGKTEFLESRFNPSLEEINKERIPVLTKIPVLSDCVQILTPYPSFDYETVNIGKNTKAVLQMTYHSGTVCTQGKGSALDFLKKCSEKNIDFYLCPLKNSENIYITTKEIINCGAIPLYNQSKESAYAKLLVAYSQKEMNPVEYMKKNLFFEKIF